MGYPFPVEKLPATLADWQQIPVSIHKTADLIPTQYYIRIDRICALANGHPPELADFTHVVTFEGKKYLYDGHHRWTLRTIHGERRMVARNFIIL